jgi:quinol monooxygenase YgiN
MFIVTVMFKVKPENLKDFVELVIDNATKSVEREPACSVFDVCQKEPNSTDVFLYEVYDTQDDFDFHLTTEHFLSFSKATENWVNGKTIHTYKKIN